MDEAGLSVSENSRSDLTLLSWSGDSPPCSLNLKIILLTNVLSIDKIKLLFAYP